MGLSIVGGTDQACPPFGVEQRGVFVSKVNRITRECFCALMRTNDCMNRFFQVVRPHERIFVLVIES